MTFQGCEYGLNISQNILVIRTAHDGMACLGKHQWGAATPRYTFWSDWSSAKAFSDGGLMLSPEAQTHVGVTPGSATYNHVGLEGSWPR